MGLPTIRAAVLALSKASLPDAKTLRDQSQAIERYYGQARDAKELEKQAAEIRIRAERRIGELLRGSVKRGQRSHDATFATLKQLGISKTQSSRWQLVASIPDRVFESHVGQGELSTSGMVAVANKLRQQSQRRGPAAGGDVYTGDLADAPLADSSVDLILTDPPYADVALYGRLAELAARKLKPGCLCLAYCGQLRLPEVLSVMGAHLAYQWTLCVRFASKQSPMIQCRQIKNGWKPIVIFSRGPAERHSFISDILVHESEKGLHVWQQPEGEANYLISQLSKPGALVVDPFCGSGTVLTAAKATGRRWLGCDVDAGAAKIARRRLAA